jgi:putative N6-adenine-specific DNA methylase
MDSSDHRFFAPCPRGLEGVLQEELQGLGLPTTIKTDGGVSFCAPWSTMCLVNLRSHIASRILWEVGQSTYKTERDVYRAAHALGWADWFTPAQTIKVKVSARRCPLPSLDFLTLRIKDAICDQFTATTQRRPTVDTNRPDISGRADRHILY